MGVVTTTSRRLAVLFVVLIALFLVLLPHTPSTVAQGTTPTYAPLPPEISWQLLFTDSFDDEGYTANYWQVGAGWEQSSDGVGQVFQVSDSEAPVTYVNDTSPDVVAQVRFLLNSGAARLSVRVSSVGAYHADLYPNGLLTLSRADTQLTLTVLTDMNPTEWHTLRVAAMGGLLRVAVDGATVLETQDASPLPAGTVSFAGHHLGSTPLLVDDFALWTASPITPTETPVPYPSVDSTFTWTTVQDTDGRLAYDDGTWETFDVAAANGGTLTGSASPGAVVRVHFMGTGIRLLYASSPDGRTFTAQVDDGPIQTVDSYDDSQTYNHLLAFEGLTADYHVLTLTNGDGAIWVEAFEIQGYVLNSPLQLSPILPTPTTLISPLAQADLSPALPAAPLAAVVEDYVVLDASTTTELVDHILNTVNVNPDIPYVVRLTSDTYTIVEEARDYSGLPVSGQVTIVGRNGLDAAGNSLTPDQITTWNTIERSTTAPDIDLFRVEPGATLTLYNVRLVNGGGPTRFSGGAIVNSGELYEGWS